MNLKLPPQATDSAFAKLKEVGSNSALRISVEGGGCSGFKYNIEFDNDVSKDDYIISKENLRIVIDPVSLKFLDGSVIDFLSSNALPFLFSSQASLLRAITNLSPCDLAALK